MELTFKILQFAIFFLQNLADSGAIFSMIKNLCIGWNHIFQVEVWGNFANERNAAAAAAAAAAQLTQGS